MTMLVGAVQSKCRKKSLTFICHDATNNKAGTNKAAINQHIAKLAHDQRKQIKALQQPQFTLAHTKSKQAEVEEKADSLAGGST